MDLLAKAYARARLAKQIPIYPKPKPAAAPPLRPLPPGTSLVADIPFKPAPAPMRGIKLPGLAPWRQPRPQLEAPPPPPPLIPVAKIIAVVSGEFCFTAEQIKGEARTQKITLARHTAMYLASRITKKSLSQLGRQYFGDRDHSTVIHAMHRIAALIAVDPTMRNRVELLERRIRNQAENRL